MKGPRQDEPYDHRRGVRPLLRPTSPSRTAVLLAVNFVAYGAACMFWHYLACGRWVDFGLEAFRRDLSTPMGNVFLAPLNVLTHPWMILVHGLLLAVLVFVPILLAVLYRQIFAWGFVAVVALLGHAPVLALALLLAVNIAARTPLRSDMPFLAFLLGLLPVGLYLYIFALAGGDTAIVLPLQRWAIYAPLLLALIVSILTASAVLALARLTKFRPGIVWPVLLVVLACPVGLFVWKVGPSELEYALIVSSLGSGDLVFPSETTGGFIRRQGLRADSPLPELRPLVERDLEVRRQRLLETCRRFVQRYPQSPRSAEALWVEAQARSAQIQDDALRAGIIRYRAAAAAPAAEATWRRLLDAHRARPQAALALWRLGQLAMSHARPQEADRLLAEAEERLSAWTARFARRQDRQVGAEVFPPPAQCPPTSYYALALHNTRRLIWLMNENNVTDNPDAAAALGDYLQALAEPLSNPQRSARLGQLAARYEATPLGDNLKLAVALATENIYERTAALTALANGTGTDAAIEANYELGRLALRQAEAPALALQPGFKTPREYFQLVLDARPNPWSQLAKEHLAWLEPLATQAPTGSP